MQRLFLIKNLNFFNDPKPFSYLKKYEVIKTEGNLLKDFQKRKNIPKKGIIFFAKNKKESEEGGGDERDK